MKKITLLFVLLSISLGFAQNLVTNGDFEDTATGAMPTPWLGYANQVVLDDISNSQCGNNNNGDSSTYQVINVTPGSTYNATFDYRWVSGSGNYDLTANIKENEINPGASLGTFVCSTTPDVWHTDGLINFTVPNGVTKIRIIFWKPNGNRPFRFDNVNVTLDNTASIEDLLKFDFKSFPNPASNFLNLSASQPINKIEIYSLIGQHLFAENIENTQSLINISNLSNGIYIIKVFIGDVTGSYKFIKQ